MYMHYARACLFLFMLIAHACSVWTWTDVCATRARTQKTWESIGNMEMAECQDVTGARVCVMLNMLVVCEFPGEPSRPIMVKPT